MPTSNNPTIELLTPNELATKFKISKPSVYRLVGRRQIPFVKIMGSLRFDANDVAAYLQHNRIETVGLDNYGNKKTK